MTWTAQPPSGEQLNRDTYNPSLPTIFALYGGPPTFHYRRNACELRMNSRGLDFVCSCCSQPLQQYLAHEWCSKNTQWENESKCLMVLTLYYKSLILWHHSGDLWLKHQSDGSFGIQTGSDSKPRREAACLSWEKWKNKKTNLQEKEWSMKYLRKEQGAGRVVLQMERIILRIQPPILPPWL